MTLFQVTAGDPWPDDPSSYNSDGQAQRVLNVWEGEKGGPRKKAVQSTCRIKREKGLKGIEKRGKCKQGIRKDKRRDGGRQGEISRSEKGWID